MRVIYKLTAILFISALAYLPSGWADEIVMTSGERFTTDHIWSEGDKIRFSMQGLVVSVLKEDVASVVRGDGEPLPLTTPAPTPSPTPPGPTPQSRVSEEAPAPAPTPLPAAEPAPPAPPAPQVIPPAAALDPEA